MDRNSVIGLVLIALIIFSGTFLFNSIEKPPKSKTTEHADTAKEANPTTSKVDTSVQESVLDTANKDTTKTIWTPFLSGENKTVTIENKDLKVKISTLGGMVSSVELKNYKDYNKKPLYLIKNGSSAYGYQFLYNGEALNTSRFYFKTESQSAFVKNEKDSASVSMVLDLGGGKKITQTYSLKGEGFMVNHRLGLDGMNTIIPKTETYLNVDWHDTIIRHESDSATLQNNTTVHYLENESHNYLTETKNDSIDLKLNTRWISFKEQFFCQSLIYDKEFRDGQVSNRRLDLFGDKINAMHTLMRMPYDHAANASYDFRFYFGPLRYATLTPYNLQLEKQIPLGWSFFLTSWVNRFIIIPIFNFLSMFVGSFGIIILLLTIIIKLIVLPFTYKSYLSTAKMKILKPELDEMKAKFKDDAVRQQKEQMAMYRKAGVSPLGGCLPTLFQIPILIAMFRFFPSSIELRQQSFLWATDLSTYDSIYNFGFNIPFYGNHISLFTLLMTISTILYTRFNSAMVPQQKEMQWLSYLMPIMFLGFFNNYAAGLSYYYFLFNVLTFAQQYLFGKFIDTAKLHAQIEENKKKPVNNTKSKWQLRLEEMQKKQQQSRKPAGKK